MIEKKGIEPHKGFGLFLSIIPLTFLPFFFEQDSTMGKCLLLLKVCFCILMFFSFSYKISKAQLVICLLGAGFSCISAYINNAAGVALLVFLLFFALIFYPQTQFIMKQRKIFFAFMFVFSFLVFIYSFYIPIMKFLPSGNSIHTIPWYVNYHGSMNSNESALLALASFFYFVSFVDECSFSRVKRELLSLCALCVTICILYILFCRSSLLAIFAYILWRYLPQRLKGRASTIIVYELLIVLFCFLWLILRYVVFGTVPENEITNIVFVGKAIFSGREPIWKCAVEGFASSPLLGQGSSYLLEATGFSTAHNVLLGILVIMGLVPTITYLVLIFDVHSLYGIKGRASAIFTISQICFLSSFVISAFECSLTDSRLNFLFLPLLLGKYSTRTEMETI